MIREYLIQEKLGIGSYGTVYKVTKKIVIIYMS